MSRFLVLLALFAVVCHEVLSDRIVPCNKARQFCGHPRSKECPADTGRVKDGMCRDGSPCCFSVDPCSWNRCPPRGPPGRKLDD